MRNGILKADHDGNVFELMMMMMMLILSIRWKVRDDDERCLICLYIMNVSQWAFHKAAFFVLFSGLFYGVSPNVLINLIETCRFQIWIQCLFNSMKNL